MTESLATVLERASKLFPRREAVVDGETRWSYDELHRRVAGFDAALDRLGLVAGDVVAFLGMNSAAHLVAWLGIPRSGRVLCDLNVRLSRAELEFILGDAGARALLVDDTFLETGRAVAAACDTVEHLIFTGAGPAPEGWHSFADLTELAGGRPAAVAPDQVAGIFYTGGTTGRPKGAMLTHRNLLVNAKHSLIAFGLRHADSYLHAAPMFHTADGTSTYAVTWVGGRHVMIPAFDAQRWLETVEAERVTRCTLVPTMVNRLVNHPTISEHDLSSLEMMHYGGSPIPEEILARAMAAMPCEWSQGYGMTEAAPLVCYLPPEDHVRGAAGELPHNLRLRSAGAPVVGVESEIRRPDGTIAEVGEHGEIWVRGPNVMKGYWNRPEETAKALDADGWYHTGDVAYTDADGYFYIVDRLADMVISGGENVYSSEVENVLHKHPAVLECAVFGVPDARWGERIHAAVVLKPGVTAQEDELIEHCRRLIAFYKTPRSIAIHDEPLPKSGAGKVLKRKLREPYWERRERQVA